MEKVLLVGIHLKGSSEKLSDAHASLDELARLVDTAGGMVIDRILQSLESQSPSTLIGRGKVDELKIRARAGEFNSLIFNDELKPAQQKNLSDAIPVKILDRTRLILDIFAKRARSREGIMQVELAQISYLLPRITERYGRFEQQVGGIGTRGPGERKLEVEARHIRDRIALLKRGIETIKMHRDVVRERRHRVPLPTVAIIGYTNAGKSTLLNTLVHRFGEGTDSIYADDKLFATLDPTTRRIRMPSGRTCLFTDTVGFIDRLPHNLIAAFRSTLEETLDADVLIHLMDSSDPEISKHSKTVLNLLQEIEAGGNERELRIIPVYNKIDLAKNWGEDSSRNDSGDQVSCAISASKGTGINALLQKVEAVLEEKMVEADLFVPFKKSGILEALYRLGKVEKVTHKIRGLSLHIKLEKSHWNKVRKLLEVQALKAVKA